jgi:hypothetical protein
MSNPKKQIIMNEITFWKQNKMLPAHYCDFLTTLYSEGNNEQEITGDAKLAIRNVEKRRKWIFVSVFPVIAIIMILLLFTIQYEWVVIVVAGVFALACFIGAIYFSKHHKLLATMLQLAMALAILGVTVKICLTYYSNNNEMLYTMLIINCALWLISGVLMKIIYFTISGVVGLAIIIGSWLYF